MYEANLVNDALRVGLPTDRTLPKEVYREPKLPTGYPDVVIAYHAHELPEYLPRRASLTTQHMRLLHFIFLSRGISIPNLEAQLFYPRQKIRKLLDELVAAGLLRISDSFARSHSLGRIFGIRRIVAIEAKVSNWKKALEQASANTWLVSKCWVLRNGTSALKSRPNCSDQRLRSRKTTNQDDEFIAGSSEIFLTTSA